MLGGDSTKYITMKIDVADIPQVVSKAGVLIPSELALEVDQHRTVEEKYWYWSDKSAAYYIDMNASSGKSTGHYKVFTESLIILHDNMTEILARSFEMFQKWENPPGRGNENAQAKLPSIDFIALGVGGVSKESDILHRFLLEYRLKKEDNAKITFIPVDLSHPLIRYAASTIIDKFWNDLSNGHMEMLPYEANFLRTTYDDFGNNKYKFITALGIVYNAQVPKVFTSLRRMMTPNSLLLIDADVIGNREPEQILQSYTSDESKKFLFEPINMLCKASQEGGEISAPARTKYRTANLEQFKKCSYENGTINAYLVSKDTVNDFVDKHRLPAEAKDHIRLGLGVKSKTVVMLYEPRAEDVAPIVLGYSTRFDYDELSKMLVNMGFEIIQRFHDPSKSSTAYFLLRRNDSIPPPSHGSGQGGEDEVQAGQGYSDSPGPATGIESGRTVMPGGKSI